MNEIFSTLVLLALYGLAAYGLIVLVTKRSQDELRDAVIWTINHSPEGIYAKDISTITGIPYSQIYIVLARLEDSGAVRYERDAKWPHRFRYFIQNTNSGSSNDDKQKA